MQQQDQQELFLSLKAQARSGPKTFVKTAYLLSEDGLEYKEKPNNPESDTKPTAIDQQNNQILNSYKKYTQRKTETPVADKQADNNQTVKAETRAPPKNTSTGISSHRIPGIVFDPFDSYTPSRQSQTSKPSTKGEETSEPKNIVNKRGIVEKPALIPIKDSPVDPVPEPVQDNQRCERATQQQFEYFQSYVSQKEKERMFEEDEQREIQMFLKQKQQQSTEPLLTIVFQKPDEQEKKKHQHSIFPTSEHVPKYQKKTIKIRVKRKADQQAPAKTEGDQVKKLKLMNDMGSKPVTKAS